MHAYHGLTLDSVTGGLIAEMILAKPRSSIQHHFERIGFDEYGHLLGMEMWEWKRGCFVVKVA